MRCARVGRRRGVREGETGQDKTLAVGHLDLGL